MPRDIHVGTLAPENQWTPTQVEAALAAYGGQWQQVEKGIKPRWVAPDGSSASLILEQPMRLCHVSILMNFPRTRPIRWSRSLRDLPVLSIRQPFAWLVVNGIIAPAQLLENIQFGCPEVRRWFVEEI